MPLHRFERAHTAFLVVVSLFEFVNNLPRKEKKLSLLYSLFHFHYFPVITKFSLTDFIRCLNW